MLRRLRLLHRGGCFAIGASFRLTGRSSCWLRRFGVVVVVDGVDIVLGAFIAGAGIARALCGLAARAAPIAPAAATAALAIAAFAAARSLAEWEGLTICGVGGLRRGLVGAMSAFFESEGPA